jgi:uridine kinase
LAADDLVRRLTEIGAGTVLIDGRSGAGKSVLADRLQAGWPGSAVVRLDDIYPGWDGLAWAAEHIRTELLEPRAAGRPGRWRRWDWTVGAAAEWHTVEPGGRLIVEGVGTLTAATRALADLGIWVETPEAVRKRRALDRDGETYRPHWQRWAAQEEAFIARHRPKAVADIVVTGH